MSPRPSAVPPPVTAVLEAGSAWLPARLGEVERLLGDLVQGHGPVLGEDAGATLSAGGKRLRPLLVLLCAGPHGGEPAVRAGGAVELVHMASLVHDDVLDDAPLRRGRPTVYASSGRERASCTGDLLFARAFSLLAAAEELEQVRLLAEASVALATGELAQRRDAFDTSLPAERYLERCRLKTGRLFESACLMGLAATGRDGPAVDQLRRFGSRIGLAFQLLDDVLDVTGPPERTGKARGADLLDGTVTLPLILAADRDPGLHDLDLRGLDAAQAGRICNRIAAAGALEDVRSQAMAMVEDAKRGLEDADFDAEQRELLALVADGVVERYS